MYIKIKAQSIPTHENKEMTTFTSPVTMVSINQKPFIQVLLISYCDNILYYNLWSLICLLPIEEKHDIFLLLLLLLFFTFRYYMKLHYKCQQKTTLCL